MFTSESRIVVRYAETDMMGIVHHSRYFPWFEVGRSEFLTRFGTSYREVEESGILMPLIESHCNYYHGARYMDNLTVKTSIGELRPTRVRFNYEVWREGELLASGYTVHAFTNRGFRPQNLKKAAPELWETLSGLIDAE